MKGYVKNKSPLWRHTMKRNIGPGGTVDLDELYQQYGEKHDIPEGPEFVEWLKHIKLKDTSIWEINLVEGRDSGVCKDEKNDKDVHESEVGPLVKEDLTIEEVIGWSVRRAREKLPRLHGNRNLQLLKMK